MNRCIDRSSDCWLSLIVKVPGGDRGGPVVCHHWWSCPLPIMLSVQCPWHTRSLFTNHSLPAWWQSPWRPLLDVVRGLGQRWRVWQGQAAQLLSQTGVRDNTQRTQHSSNTMASFLSWWSIYLCFSGALRGSHLHFLHYSASAGPTHPLSVED